MIDEFTIYFTGEKLYGDDFSSDQIYEWFVDEAERFTNLGAKEKCQYSYGYHQLDQIHAFRFIRARRFNHALGIGAAYGDEFKPIAGNIARITILEPSDTFSGVTEIFGIPCEYKRPSIIGDIEFESNHFDLITSLGVIHHIPNVSHVLAECYRCLDAGGIMLLREPIASLGDWRKPRKGPTRRERGIPLRIMDNMIKNIGFKIIRRSLCNFSPIPAILNKLGLRIHTYNNMPLTVVDALLSKAFSWNNSYHRTRLYKKFAPSLAYYVLEK